jgi:glycosyltransferase involved in cell wall biosynthesis
MSTTLPKITIVTPSFNQAKYLEDTILSVLNQGYPNLEYIVIDGGSTDESVDIIKKYEKQLAFWKSEKDNGLYNAIQQGFDKSTGEIMAWLNADDMHHQKCLFTVARIFQKFGQVQWLMGINTFFDESGRPFIYDDLPYGQRWSRRRLLLSDGRFIQQESVFWRRTLWEKAGGLIKQQHSLAADFELWLRFSRHEKLYTTTFMLGGFRFRTENQKSYEQREEYLNQVRAILSKEYKADFSSQTIKFKLALAKWIPKKKWRNKVIVKILDLPPRIEFDREQEMILSQRNLF